MKFKAARPSLAAFLAVCLSTSLLPLMQVTAVARQTQSSNTNTSHQRRGKNGEPVASTPDDKNTGHAEQDFSPPTKTDGAGTEAAKPAASKSAAKPDASQSAGPPEVNTRRASPPRSWPSSDQSGTKGDPSSLGASREQETQQTPGGTGQATPDSQEKSDAPAFDRPPLKTGRQAQRSAGGSTPRTSQPPSSTRADSQRSTNRTWDSGSSRTSQDRTGDSSSGGGDTERTDRPSGAPPVLRRSQESPSSGGSGDSSRSQRPPVLRRPGDPEPTDAGRSSDATGGRQQQGPGQQQSGDGDEVVKLESTLVSIPLLVSDRSGRYVPQLSARDFTLYEDGVEQKIASFGSEEVPFSVALMLDVSPSVQGSVRDIQDAAIDFVRQLREQDRVMVVSFDRHIHYLCEFTSDRRELESAIRRAGTGPGTSVYDAVYEVVARRMRNIEGRKALILFSDGEDTTSSRASYDDAVNLVSESDVLVYGLRYPGTGNGGGGIRVDPWPRSPIPRIPFPFPFPWPNTRRRGPFTITSLVGDPAPQWSRRRNSGGGSGADFMKDITAAGGGPVYDAERISDMVTVAHRIAEELRHVYVLSYYPTNALSNGGYRRVRVSLNRRDDLAVRHRPGYNARPNGGARPTI